MNTQKFCLKLNCWMYMHAFFSRKGVPSFPEILGMVCNKKNIK